MTKELITEFMTVEHNKQTVSFVPTPLTEAGRGSDKYLCDYSFVLELIRSLTGDVLTIVDSAIPQGVQSKCTKDLVRKAFGDKLQLLGELLLDQEDIQKMSDEHSANGGKECEPVDLQDIIDNNVKALLID